MQDIPLIALKGGFISLLPVLRLINHIWLKVGLLCSYPYLATEALPNTGQRSLQTLTQQSSHTFLMP